MTAKLRVAVIGVGHLGRHHARILGSLEGATLVGVVDAKADRASEIAAGCGTVAVRSASDLLGQVDAVSIAVPTEAHLAVAMPFLQHGIPVLVEEPLARDVAEADAMIDAAARAGVVLAVGHTERYNPAVAAAARYLDNPRFIEVHRLGTFPERSLDIDVVFDLMIHDLDLVLSLVPSEVSSIEAVGVPVLTGRVDIANARLRFENGCIANITASRISRDRTRKIRFFQQDAYLSIDYAAQEVEMYRLVRGQERPAIDGGKLDVLREEPLKRELADFLGAVREGRRPLVAGEDGRRALALAQRITERMAAGN
ncbi:MAG: gfo/Idh/MocA family oxidoreductase [Acidobacteria bacterium]|nr:MAG: gfo/Idh/MocA family oxidoreductase [Acidobacteriota bacterium]